MDLSIILETKKINIIKNTKRTIDKLFLLHKQNKITDFPEKIEKLKDLINRNIKEIQDIIILIKKREKYSPLIFYIVEFFNTNMCYKSSRLLMEKYKMESDLIFFKEQDELIRNYNNNSFLPLIKYIKDHKNVFKNYDLEENLKVSHFINLCIKEEFDEGISFFKKNDINKKYLIYLISKKEIKISTNLDVLKEAFGISNIRLQKRIEYGLISFKTKMCYKYPNKECPSCLFKGLRKDIPFNRREHSLILCKGSNEVISEENRGLAYDSGHVYGEKYVKGRGFRVEDNKYPRHCYFM